MDSDKVGHTGTFTVGRINAVGYERTFSTDSQCGTILVNYPRYRSITIADSDGALPITSGATIHEDESGGSSSSTGKTVDGTEFLESYVPG